MESINWQTVTMEEIEAMGYSAPSPHNEGLAAEIRRLERLLHPADFEYVHNDEVSDRLDVLQDIESYLYEL